MITMKSADLPGSIVPVSSSFSMAVAGTALQPGVSRPDFKARDGHMVERRDISPLEVVMTLSTLGWEARPTVLILKVAQVARDAVLPVRRGIQYLAAGA